MRNLEKKKEYNRQYALSHKEEHRAAMKRWRSNLDNHAKERRRLRDYNRYRKDREAFLALRRLRVHGLTKEEYDAMIVTQNNQCAICQKQMKSPNIDHNHETGNTRELLCRYCNTMLGMCFEKTEILQSAMDYLKKHS